jgi:hypothetical protein
LAHTRTSSAEVVYIVVHLASNVQYCVVNCETQGNVFRDAPLYILLLRYWFGYVPNLVNSVDILAIRHVKQGIEAETFRAVQPLVQETYITLLITLNKAVLLYPHFKELMHYSTTTSSCSCKHFRNLHKRHIAQHNFNLLKEFKMY